MRLKQNAKPRLSLRTRIVYTIGGISLAAILGGIIFFLYSNLGTSKKALGGPGMAGAKTVSSTNLKVNEFTTLTADASIGSNVITVASSSLNSNSRFSSSLQAGELIMICQSQGASITSSSTGMVTVGTQNTTSATGGPYLKGSNTDCRVQYLFTAAELTAAGLSACSITSLSFNVSSLGSGTMSNWTISMATTAATSMTSTFLTGTFTTVCSPLWGGIDGVSGWNVHNFTTPFSWNGTSNIVVQICYSASGSNTTTVAQSNTSNRTAYYNGTSACTHTTGTTVSTRPVVRFGYSVDNTLWGAVSSYNNAGNFEFADVSSVVDGTHIKIVGALKNSYSSSGHVQIVRVPRYSSLTVNSGASLTTDAWNGSTGGILAIEVNGGATINGTLDVSGLGFRGGTMETNSTENPRGNYFVSASVSSYDGSEKGESIAGSQSDYDALGGRYSRAAPANGGGGGNSHNSGGGGGSNAGSTSGWDGLGNPSTSTSGWSTAWNLEGGSFSTHTSPGGGRGGYTYSDYTMNPLTLAPGNSSWGGDSRNNVGGLGGRPLTYTSSKIFMGGGGGAGDGDDNKATNGAAGGGIVYLLIGGSLSGSGTISANGAAAAASTGATPKDAAGGGGGGGTIFVYRTSGTLSSSITLNAKGGKGGDQSDPGPYTGEAEGPGGGGGGGYISYTTPGTPTTSVSGGANGTVNAPVMSTFLPNGATGGGPGTVTTNPVNPYTSYVYLPIQLVSFSCDLNDKNTVDLRWETASEYSNKYFIIERSSDALQWMGIDTVAGAGNSYTPLDYSDQDLHPLTGKSYYRLKQCDFDMRYSYSNVEIVNLTSDKISALNEFSAYPNPTRGMLNISVRNVTNETMIRIFDIKGTLVKEIKPTPGADTQIDLTGRSPGIYLVKVGSGGANDVSKQIELNK